MCKPKLNVCLITYNHESFIAQAIEGILMQNTNFSIKLIIGEDCSTDNTRIICEDYEQKYPDIIKLLPKEESNLGMMPNFIRTLEACKRKYIALCEGDDYWNDPLKLQKQVDFLETHTEYAICYHPIKILKNNEIVNDNITREVKSITTTKELAIGNYIHTPSVVFRNNKFPNWLKKCSIGDYPLHLYNSQFGKIMKLRDSMAVYRIHNSNTWANSCDQNIKIINYLFELIDRFDEETNIVLKKRLQKLFFTLYEAKLANKNIKKKYCTLFQDSKHTILIKLGLPYSIYSVLFKIVK